MSKRVVRHRSRTSVWAGRSIAAAGLVLGVANWFTEVAPDGPIPLPHSELFFISAVLLVGVGLWFAGVLDAR